MEKKKDERVNFFDAVNKSFNNIFDELPTYKQDPEEEKIYNEKKDPYKIYHDTYSAAVQHGLEHTKNQGYDISRDETDRNISMGPAKPGEGQTTRVSLALTKDGKPIKKMLHMQVYNNGKHYELNKYVR